MDPVVHFEMPAEDRKRMSKFYTEVFGWKTQETGPEMGNYVLATTVEVDANMMPTKPGAINGGFYEKTKDMGKMHPSVVISVENLTESIRKVEGAGGKIIGEPMDIPGVGMFVSFSDTEGNRIGMLEPMKK